MRVAVDQDRCCGSGMCVLTAPGVFDQRDEDGIVVLLDERPHAELWRQVRDAESGCPSQAIEVSEECQEGEVSQVSEECEE
ncbi:ferredoxin [Actinacidiphila acidipaludis]|uniref:Ferredoxin n=1 Tax=Actinacidiphila acidipaludis TaxID=2873382 RepID=A0ABS7QJJ4_9ACTN|nr:ferredoxin [Streptomyces acidipaludis]MBY8882600.1 ferredoxin [Streptomyces acidipaludis]